MLSEQLAFRHCRISAQAPRPGRNVLCFCPSLASRTHLALSRVPWVLFQCHKKSICLLRWVWSTTEPLLFSCLSLSRWAYLRCLQSRSPLSGIMAILSGLGFQPQVRRSRRGRVLCRDENWQASSDPSSSLFAFLLLKSYQPRVFTVALFVFLDINFLWKRVTLVGSVWLWFCTSRLWTFLQVFFVFFCRNVNTSCLFIRDAG